jgi:O-antigen/teichoic acid export membrane protein
VAEQGGAIATLGAPQPLSPVPPEPDRPGVRARLAEHLAQPFFRNAYALLVNTGLTGVLGLAYWFLAARHYTDADVGRGSTALSVMSLLSGVVAFNVTGTLNRFLPASGRSGRRLVLQAYLLSALAVLALTLGFLATLDLWGPSFDLFRDPTFRWQFLVAAVAAGLFTVQDGVLTGLRASVWIPVENALFGVAKIVLLVVWATAFPAEGVFLSWFVPMLVVLLPTNALVFGRLLPRHARAAEGREAGYTGTEVRRFLIGDYTGALFMFATVSLVPVLVANRVEPFVYAYFFVAWVVGSLLNLVAANMATSLTVEGGYDITTLAANCRAALGRVLLLLLMATVVVCLAARPLLGALGRGYLDAVPLLQLLAFAALPRAVTEIYVGVLRAQGRARLIARVQVLRGVLVLGLVYLCLHLSWLQDHWGISVTTSVGLAVLVSQTVVALAVAAPLRTFMLASRPAALDTAATRAPVVLDLPASAHPAAPTAARPGRWVVRPVVVVLAVASAATLPLFLLPLRGVQLSAMNGLGLVSVLPVASLVAVDLLTVAFALTLCLPRPAWLLMAAQVVLLVVLLHGVTLFLEAQARFPISWVHAGFVEYIGRTGTVAVDLDARFSWPGFFAFVAFVVGPGHQHALQVVLALTPVLTNLLLLVPFALLLRTVRGSWQARWFALFLFPLLNWVGQDYFSPQGETYLLYLLFVALLVTWFRPSTRPTAGEPRRFRRLRQVWARALPAAVPGEAAPRPIGVRERTVLLGLLVGLFAAATTSHQLTPFLMLFSCGALVVVRRCTATGLPLLLGVLLAGWVSYMTAAYWSGHLAGLLSGLGNVTGNVSSSVTGRAQGGAVQHQLVVYGRIGVALAVFGLAAVGLLRRRLRGRQDRVLFVLLAVPFTAVALQNYGGEIALRIYLFALPAAACLVALAFFPRAAGRPSLLSRAAALSCTLVLLGGFFVARYGNESYEQIRSGDVAAVQAIYDRSAGEPTTVVYLNESDSAGATPFMPLGYQDVDTVSWSSARAPLDPADVSPAVEALRAAGPRGLLITTYSQEQNLVLGNGYPAGWGDRFRAAMAASPDVRIVTQNADAVVYGLAEPLQGPVASPGRAAGPELLTTPWSAVGLVFFALLVAVLGAREVWRLRLAGSEHARLRPLTLAALPLLIGVSVVVVERLVMLGS